MDQGRIPIGTGSGSQRYQEFLVAVCRWECAPGLAERALYRKPKKRTRDAKTRSDGADSLYNLPQEPCAILKSSRHMGPRECEHSGIRGPGTRDSA